MNRAESRIILYADGLFESNQPVLNENQLESVRTSGFNTVVLWTLHVDPEGTLLYSNVPIVRNGVFTNTFNYLPPLVARLLAPGSTVHTVQIGVGSGQSSDFVDIQNVLALPEGEGKVIFRRNFNALQVALPNTGFDFDDEDLITGGPGSPDVNTVAQFGSLLGSGLNDSNVISYCPCWQTQSFWADCLTATLSTDVVHGENVQPVRWMGVQTYSGSEVPAFAQAIAQNNDNGQPTGVADPASFVLPGYSVGDGGMTPDEVQTAVAAAVKQNSALPGAFVWNSSQIFASSFTLSQYAQAIRSGLAGKAIG